MEKAARPFPASASTFSHWSQSCLGDNWQAFPPTGTEYRTGLDCGGAGLVTLPKQTSTETGECITFLSWIRTPWNNILRSVYFFVSYLIYDTPRAGLLLVFMSVVKKVSENASMMSITIAMKTHPNKQNMKVFPYSKNILGYIYLLIKTHEDKTSQILRMSFNTRSKQMKEQCVLLCFKAF